MFVEIKKTNFIATEKKCIKIILIAYSKGSKCCNDKRRSDKASGYPVRFRTWLNQDEVFTTASDRRMVIFRIPVPEMVWIVPVRSSTRTPSFFRNCTRSDVLSFSRSSVKVGESVYVCLCVCVCLHFCECVCVLKETASGWFPTTSERSSPARSAQRPRKTAEKKWDWDKTTSAQLLLLLLLLLLLRLKVGRDDRRLRRRDAVRHATGFPPVEHRRPLRSGRRPTTLDDVSATRRPPGKLGSSYIAPARSAPSVAFSFSFFRPTDVFFLFNLANNRQWSR